MTQAASTRVTLLRVPLVNESPASASDAKSQALERLIHQAGHLRLDRVRVTVLDGWIVLRGRVSSFYLKQLAQEAVRPGAIGMQIRNELRVDH